MLVTTLDEYKYNFLPSPIIEALEEAMLLFKDRLPENGIYDLKNNAKAIVARYNSKNFDDTFYESHKDMTDIQIILEGEEYIYTCPHKNLTLTSKDYDKNSENDLYFYDEKPNEYARAYMTKGTFAVIYPPIAHAPSIMVESSSPVVKMVIKVPFNS